MTFMRASVRLVCSTIPLCVPFVSASQTATVVPTQATQQSLSPTAAPLDTADRLEGRLFFSAQERQRMDAARRRGLVVGDDGQLVEAPPSVLNGFVKRSDGNTAVWVDGNVRWNAKSKNADSLLPSDVGGPSEYLKSTNGEVMVVSTKHTAFPKKTVKPRAQRITKPRLLP